MQRTEPNTDPLPVRYDMPYPEVYEQFAKYSIRLSGTLKYLETLPPLQYKSSLPSWVVDLQVPAKYPSKQFLSIIFTLSRKTNPLLSLDNQESKGCRL